MQKTRVWFPTPHQAAHNQPTFSSMAPDALFWPPQGLHVHGAQYAAIHIKQKQVNLFFKYIYMAGAGFQLIWKKIPK